MFVAPGPCNTTDANSAKNANFGDTRLVVDENIRDSQ